MQSVAILLSTYNGDKYLDEQIKSIITQTYTNWKLYIRDDGSVDKTPSIIDYYVRNYKNIFRVEDEESNIGACKSFFKLLQYAESDYYMFCDQDDIWLPIKIETTLNRMVNAENRNPKIPILVCSDLKLVDQKLDIISESMWKHSKINTAILSKWKYLRVSNLVTGCTMMINKLSKEIGLQDFESAQMHDSWISLKVASEDGIIIPIYTQLILYRQHGMNVIGSPVKADSNYFFSKFTNLHKVLKEFHNRYRYINCIRKTSYVSFLISKIIYQFSRIAI